METRGKTTVIDSDFRTSAIVHSLSNALLFSFSISSTIVFSRLAQKSNNFDGVNVLVMAIISGIVSIVAGALFIYTLYKLIKVAENRDSITNQLTGKEEEDFLPREISPAAEKRRQLEESFKESQGRNIRFGEDFKIGRMNLGGSRLNAGGIV